MPTESELRAALRDTPSAGSPSGAPVLDSDDVIRRARARRRPRQLAFGSVAALAVAGFAYAGISAIPWPQAGLMSASDTMGEATTGSEFASPGAAPGAVDPVAGGAKRQPASSINRCGQPLEEIGPTASGLVLTADFPSTGIANGLSVDGTVTLTNTGSARVAGVTAAEPTVVLSRDGITVWHSNGAVRSIGYLVDLAPGQSKEFPASFTPVLCSPGNEDSASFPGDLPPLGPGAYRVSVLLDLAPVVADDAGEAGEVVGGPSQDLALTGG
jgi:hypothetical protein